MERLFVQQTSRCQQQHQHLSLSYYLSHTPTHANKRNWGRPFSHHYVNQTSLHSGCCVIAPSILHRCSEAHRGAASTSSNCLLIRRAPLHLWISVASGRTWCTSNHLNLSWVLFLRDSQRDMALHKATAPIDPLRVACGQRHVLGTRAPILAHLQALLA